MPKNSFLDKLRYELYFFKESELEQIIEDYDSLIEEKLAENISIEDVIESLDSPELIAQNYADELEIKVSSIDKVFVNGKKEIAKKFNDFRNKPKEEKVKKEKREKKQNAFYQDFKAIIVFFIVVVIKILLFLFKFTVCSIYLIVLSIVIMLFMSLFIFFNFGSYQITIVILSAIGVISYIVFSSFIMMKILQIKIKKGNTR